MRIWRSFLDASGLSLQRTRRAVSQLEKLQQQKTGELDTRLTVSCGLYVLRLRSSLRKSHNSFVCLPPQKRKIVWPQWPVTLFRNGLFVLSISIRSVQKLHYGPVCAARPF